VADEEQNNETTEETPEQAEEAAAEQAAPEAQAVEEAPADEPAAEPAADPAPAAEADEAPVEEPAPPPAAEKKKRKRLPRSERHTHSRPARERPAERKPITRTPKPQPERGRRQERRGVVVSNAMDKTIVVKVDTIKAHPRYKKVVRRSVKFHAHDEQNSANIGDVVRIVETRPLSKSKHWKLVQIVEAAK
jgi:small subunit ribosomal protein S17